MSQAGKQAAGKKPAGLSHANAGASSAALSSPMGAKGKKNAQNLSVDHDFDFDPLHGTTAALVDPTQGKDGSRPNSASQLLSAKRKTEYIKPEDQVLLNEEQLSQEIFKTITAKNLNAPSNVARFNFKERGFKVEPILDQLNVHFSMESVIIHKDSEDAAKQAVQLQESQSRREKKLMKEADTQIEDDFLTASGTATKSSFDYSERATQTYNNPPKHRASLTEPPPIATFSENVTQWEIFDAYASDLDRIKHQKEKAKKTEAKEVSKEDEAQITKQSKHVTSDDAIHTTDFMIAAKVMERMVNQNTFNEVAQDFKFWDDPSDQYREDGSMLPLWKFTFEKAKKRAVTSIVWNPDYTDMFAVGYGSYDFLKPTSGVIACFSLKNPSYPEYWFTTDSGVTALDFHPQHSSLLAVGLYDGRVLVFDVQAKVNRPIYQSSTKTGKHTDPVWQVKWQEEDMSKELQFFSISSDGRVSVWTMVKTELSHADLIELKFAPSGAKDQSETEDESSLYGLSAGCCFDFNKVSEHLFVVGTEEGQIHKCSKAYNSQYLETYEGHSMAVYNLKWNNYHPRIFLSCSADWNVRLWDHSQRQALLSLDLNSSVGSVCWAPYSSTIFAAATADGRVSLWAHIYIIEMHEKAK
eukprot:TRINITY_DN2321_c0_g1_i3.p1 TRINITY_DN2321_c0_g1~~TRINITY_DN2321_c0_g1_i3.p1  ORF type:complete len:638 (-),score=139.64 TRINITY_DN2321_c0_g1_i3:1739-3652(-)